MTVWGPVRKEADPRFDAREAAVPKARGVKQPCASGSPLEERCVSARGPQVGTSGGPGRDAHRTVVVAVQLVAGGFPWDPRGRLHPLLTEAGSYGRAQARRGWRSAPRVFLRQEPDPGERTAPSS